MVTHRKEEEIAALYLSLMEELKDRIYVLNRHYHNQMNYPRNLSQEICYLELRYICEIIAIGCLVAHGDVSNAKEKYEPGKVFKSLEALNPHFYPQPIERNKEGKLHAIKGLGTSDYLAKKDLIELWGRSGNILHRTPYVKYMENRDQDFHGDIFKWGRKISALLNEHIITLEENKRVMMVSLATQPDGKAETSFLDFDSAEMTVNAMNFRAS